MESRVHRARDPMCFDGRRPLRFLGNGPPRRKLASLERRYGCLCFRLAPSFWHSSRHDVHGRAHFPQHPDLASEALRAPKRRARGRRCSRCRASRRDRLWGFWAHAGSRRSPRRSASAEAGLCRIDCDSDPDPVARFQARRPPALARRDDDGDGRRERSTRREPSSRALHTAPLAVGLVAYTTRRTEGLSLSRPLQWGSSPIRRDEPGSCRPSTLLAFVALTTFLFAMFLPRENKLFATP